MLFTLVLCPPRPSQNDYVSELILGVAVYLLLVLRTRNFTFIPEDKKASDGIFTDAYCPVKRCSSRKGMKNIKRTPPNF